MAYTTTAELVIAAGGAEAFAQISDDSAAATIALAQATVDGEIDAHARQLFGTALPFNPVPDAIRGMAARETVRVLREFKRIPTDKDADNRKIFEAWLEALKAGNVIPPADDTYPISDGGGTPAVIDGDDVDANETLLFSRENLKGFV